MSGFACPERQNFGEKSINATIDAEDCNVFYNPMFTFPVGF